MKKVGLLGGTFNPPHIGHCIIANEVLHALNLDEVRLMPNAIAPHKKVLTGATNEQRIEMLKLAVSDVEKLRVEPFEVERGGISYSFETMRLLCEREPEVEFYFIIGGDSIDTLHTWYEIDELVKLVQFVGVNRPGFQSRSKYDVLMVEIPEINISSSLLRERLAANESVHFLLPSKVESFIRKEGLYGTRAWDFTSGQGASS